MNTIKSFYFILILVTLFSCKNATPIFIENDEDHAKIHDEMNKISEEISKFDQHLIVLYSLSEKNPQLVITKADSLLEINKNEKDQYKSQIKKNVESDLNYLKAELYYKTGNYNQSIKELNKDYQSQSDAAAYAANYAKLKQYDKAKFYIDKIGEGYYIYDYALGNYNEVIGNKEEALAIYKKIKDDKEIKHYAYYPLAVARFDELSKNNPKLLDEIYFPTGNPGFDIADSDNENRDKIFDMIFEMPEAKGKSVSIFESPQTNDKDYYWIKVGKSTGYLPEDLKTEFSFFIYPKDFTIKYYDEKNNKLLTIDEWRKSR